MRNLKRLLVSNTLTYSVALVHFSDHSILWSLVHFIKEIFHSFKLMLQRVDAMDFIQLSAVSKMINYHVDHNILYSSLSFYSIQ